jgi:hydrogenase maturation protease
VNVLVAGFGNVFFSDDGMASEVIRMLAREELGAGVVVRDFGTGGMHLALEMLEGYDRVIIVDAVGREAPPGTVFAIDCTGEEVRVDAAPDPHAIGIGSMLALYRRVREQTATPAAPQILVVGCVPESLDEGMELSPPVRAALPACVELVRNLARQTAVMGASSE